MRMKALVPKRKLKTKGRKFPRESFRVTPFIDPRELRKVLEQRLKDEKAGA